MLCLSSLRYPWVSPASHVHLLLAIQTSRILWPLVRVPSSPRVVTVLKPLASEINIIVIIVIVIYYYYYYHYHYYYYYHYIYFYHHHQQQQQQQHHHQHQHHHHAARKVWLSRQNLTKVHSYFPASVCPSLLFFYPVSPVPDWRHYQLV